MKHKWLTISTLIVFHLVRSPAFAEKKLDSLKKELVLVTHDIQLIENQFDGSTQELITNIENESQALEKVNAHQLSFSHTLQRAKAFVQRSPLILMVMPLSVSDIIHSYMLLNQTIPQVERKKKHVLKKLKEVQHIRSARSKLKNKQRDIALRYESLRARQDQLLFQKSHLLKYRNFKQKQSGEDSIESTLFGLINVLEKNKSKVKGKSIQLLAPILSHKNHYNRENQPLTRVFESRPSAQVVSPFDGTVIYVSYDKSGRHIIIMRSGAFYTILSGLGSVNCYVGENLLKGEPLGRMPGFSQDGKQALALSFTQPLDMNLYKGNQQIDPSPYFF